MKQRHLKTLSLKEINTLSKSKENFIEINDDEYINLVNICLGFYFPLRNFSNQKAVNSILNNSEYEKKKWTIPILLSIKRKPFPEKNKFYKLIYKKKIVGCIKFSCLFNIDKKNFSKRVFKTNDQSHPGVKKLYRLKKTFIDGDCYLNESSIPKNKYFKKSFLLSKNQKNLSLRSSVAFSTRNICHKGHDFIQSFLNKKFDNLFIVVIQTSKNKYKPKTIFSSYEFLNKFKKKKNKIISIFLPLFLAGPKEAFIQSQVIKNIGIKSFFVGRDHAGVGNFYEKFASQKIFDKLNVKSPKIIKTKEPVICMYCNTVRFFDGKKDCKKCLKKNNFSTIDGFNVKKLLINKNNKRARTFLNKHIQDFLQKKQYLI